MTRSRRMTAAALAAGAALAAMGALARPAAAAPMVYDRCTGTDHFPAQPVANAPSKQTFGLALDRTYAGMPLTIGIGGASGNQSGSATVGQDGRAQVDVPLFQYGQHMVSSASVGGESIPPGDVVPGGSFTVNDAEQVCTAAQLTPAPAAAATTTTSTTTTTAPAVAAPTTTVTTSTTTPAAAATTSTSTSTTTLASGTADSTVEAAGVPVSSDDGDDDDSILFPALVATGALVALGGAGLMVRGRTLSPGGSTTADVTDEELRAAALKEFGTPAPTANIEEDWRLLVHREQQVQQRVEEEVQRTLDAVGAGLGDFLKAVDDYRSTFTLVMSSTTEMQGLLVEWDEVKSIARKQDLAFGIITLAWSGGSLGLKAVKWLRTPKVAASAPRTAADFYKAYNEALQAGDQLAMARLAEEAGVDLTSWVGRFDDAEAAGHALMQVVAERRGWVQIGDGAETLINRLLVNGRSAMSGRVATLAADDLAQLRQLAQQPGFWERLGKAANWVEESARVGDRADPVQIIRLLYSADDIAFLKALTESGELALLADRVAVGGAAADSVRTVLLGEDAVRTVVGLGDDVTATVLLDDLAKTQILDDPLAVTRILDGIDDTVILGAHEMPTMIWQPLRNADAATAATQILDASLTAPTVILQPGGLAPTVILGGDDAARAATVLFGDAATAPTLLLNADAATAATHVFQPGALAPTVILNGEDAAGATTRMFHAVWEQPTMLLAPGGPGASAGTAPTLILHGDDAATAATQLFGNP
ncbi:MAG TPA: hypothetical protein VFV35_05030, partial [Acidimicrobiales bacterium]|nr:hypothetical protein [Acidimicrobiales bacterium]